MVKWQLFAALVISVIAMALSTYGEQFSTFGSTLLGVVVGAWLSYSSERQSRIQDNKEELASAGYAAVLSLTSMEATIRGTEIILLPNLDMNSEHFWFRLTAISNDSRPYTPFNHAALTPLVEYGGANTLFELQGMEDSFQAYADAKRIRREIFEKFLMLHMRNEYASDEAMASALLASLDQKVISDLKQTAEMMKIGHTRLLPGLKDLRDKLAALLVKAAPKAFSIKNLPDIDLTKMNTGIPA